MEVYEIPEAEVLRREDPGHRQRRALAGETNSEFNVIAYLKFLTRYHTFFDYYCSIRICTNILVHM